MRKNETTGLLYALGGFAMLSMGDAVVKSMTGQWPPTAIAATRYALGAVGLSVLLGLREGRAGFALPHLPLLSALGMSLLMIGNRFVAGKASSLAMQFSVAVMATPLLLLAVAAGHTSGMPRFALSMPDWTVLARCALVACSASLAHWLIYMGTTRAGPATVAPMTYVQLLVATLMGWTFFGDRPDGLTMLGAAIIIGAGLYLWNAGRRRERQEAA